MREKLQKSEGERDRYSGRFIRFGSKRGGTTVLLQDVKFGRKYITDHLWFNLTDGFKKIYPCPGDIIYFDARSKEYTKGYKGKNEEKQNLKPIEHDYKLNYPTNFSKDWKKNKQSNSILKFLGSKTKDWDIFSEYAEGSSASKIAKSNDIDESEVGIIIRRCEDVCYMKPIERSVTLAIIEMGEDKSMVDAMMDIFHNKNIKIYQYHDMTAKEFKRKHGVTERHKKIFIEAQKIFLAWG